MAFNMDFGLALNLLRAGCAVKRQAHAADPRFVFLVPRNAENHGIFGPNLDVRNDAGEVVTPAQDLLLIGTAVEWNTWQPTTPDILATDWMDA